MPNNRESFKLIDSEITLRKLEIFSVFMENQNLARTAEVLVALGILKFVRIRTSRVRLKFLA